MSDDAKTPEQNETFQRLMNTNVAGPRHDRIAVLVILEPWMNVDAEEFARKLLEDQAEMAQIIPYDERTQVVQAEIRKRVYIPDIPKG